MKFPKAIADLIPPPGKDPHKEFAEERICDTVAEAKRLFEKATERLQQPHLWKELTGVLGADFQPHKSDGKAFEGRASVGDLLRIKVGGPIPLGNDWVVVSHMVSAEEEGVEALALQVHPCAPPPDSNTSGTQKEPEHFFDECATSTWIICRQEKRVSVHYRGRQEVPNEGDQNVLRSIRDKVVAVAAIIGLADLQWKALLKGLLED